MIFPHWYREAIEEEKWWPINIGTIKRVNCKKIQDCETMRVVEKEIGQVIRDVKKREVDRRNITLKLWTSYFPLPFSHSLHIFYPFVLNDIFFLLF